jgi:hypothetical protein
VTAVRPARDRYRPALLSGLVFPGLGQLATGHPWRALAFGGSSVALLVAVVLRVMRETQRLLPEDPAALVDPALPFRLAVEVHRANAAFFLDDPRDRRFVSARSRGVVRAIVACACSRRVGCRVRPARARST